MPDKPLVARVFELETGCSSLRALHKLLRQEGYSSALIESHLCGLHTRRQLKQRYNGGEGVKKTGFKQSGRDAKGRYQRSKADSRN